MEFNYHLLRFFCKNYNNNKISDVFDVGQSIFRKFAPKPCKSIQDSKLQMFDLIPTCLQVFYVELRGTQASRFSRDDRPCLPDCITARHFLVTCMHLTEKNRNIWVAWRVVSSWYVRVNRLLSEEGDHHNWLNSTSLRSRREWVPARTSVTNAGREGISGFAVKSFARGPTTPRMLVRGWVAAPDLRIHGVRMLTDIFYHPRDLCIVV